MPNRLAQETSPYLLQHANNPVDWYPWGPDALARAAQEDRPIFLSIGYSACHWCHVMEHESFENPQLAELLNAEFVPIKVDREERPDLDQVYMNAVQMLTGRGGWPMSMFLTPELKPFFGGTYWPPHRKMGMPGFDEVLMAVADAWKHRRAELTSQADQLTLRLGALGDLPAGEAELDRAPLAAAEQALGRLFDPAHGGFGGAPKFPHPMDLRLLLRLWRHSGRQNLLDMARHTLDKMASGGIYDHLGGGFHRYSVDERWLVPHFEKMLYDNALLTTCYLEAFQATGEPRYERVVRETLDYTLREMCDPAGGFLSTQDADSEGVEGKFYVWTPAEIEQALGAAAAKTFCYVYDVSHEGNFEEQNILNLPKMFDQCSRILQRDRTELEAELAVSRAKLLAVRSQRVWPGLDDKVLVSWNGLMIAAMAQAGAALNEPRYVEQASRAARFILDQMRRPDGRLLHTYRQGQARFDAYLDDYACLADALVTLYEATFDEGWIHEAVSLADIVLERFTDAERGGFFYTADDHEELVARPKDIQDSSVPSGSAMAATALLRLGRLSGRTDYLNAAIETIRSFVPMMRDYPTATGQMLLALDFHLGPTPELALVAGEETATSAVLADLRRRFWPNKVLALRTDPERGAAELAPMFAGKQSIAPGPTLYVCEHFACQEPIAGEAKILAAWRDLASRVE
ncbi:MAG TPA: thioredoxin domain-containing protein [Pirellulales bacterium]|jgi:hypothetical protein